MRIVLCAEGAGERALLSSAAGRRCFSGFLFFVTLAFVTCVFAIRIPLHAGVVLWAVKLVVFIVGYVPAKMCMTMQGSMQPMGPAAGTMSVRVCVPGGCWECWDVCAQAMARVAEDWSSAGFRTNSR